MRAHTHIRKHASARVRTRFLFRLSVFASSSPLFLLLDPLAISSASLARLFARYAHALACIYTRTHATERIRSYNQLLRVPAVSVSLILSASLQPLSHETQRARAHAPRPRVRPSLSRSSRPIRE